MQHVNPNQDMNRAGPIYALSEALVVMDAAYWDLNGTTEGAGADEFGAAEGTWDASTTFWNNKADGTGSAAGTAFRLAIFAAGSGATGTYTVHVDGTQEIAGLRFEEGNVTLQPAEEPGTPGQLK
jgi:hypothetical protein